jgi:hypothetical protein
MQAWLAAHGFARENLEGQQRYMAHEAMHDYSRSRNSLMNAMDPIAAGDVVERDFERPRILNNRHQAFRYAYSAAGNQRVTITATPGGNVVISRRSGWEPVRSIAFRPTISQLEPLTAPEISF